MPTIGIITRYAPSTRAITATDAAALADALARSDDGLRVLLYCAGGRYDGAHAKESEPGRFETVRLDASDPAKTGVSRLLNSVVVGMRLAWASRHCDVVVAQTDPPLVGLWVGLLRALRRRPWADWTMDLYPDAFVAAGLAGPRALPVRLIQWLQRRLRPTLTIALGDGQSAYLVQIGRAGARTEVLPCGVPRSSSPPPAAGADDARGVSATYAGNIGQAHDVDRVAAALFGFADAGAAVTVAPSGAKADALRAAVAQRPEIQLRASMSHAELAQVDFHVASLADAWTHLCVPSKAVTAASLGAHVIFLGRADSDSARLAGQRCLVLPPTLSLDEIRAECRRLAEQGRPRDPDDPRVPAQHRYTAGLASVSRSLRDLCAA
ncbi:hypothetical protein Strain138_001776 [Pseudogemmatithrix spongiicola]|uniref:Glycosyltransferase subfamily 4-like N-terminal domain-containing protein n=1 Tax=Pseudogemmatithrix spongiicola TaxID=3062599 RepID=A0AA49Q8S3_9BACT|nr:hypothetical protein Strain138_001776 [Gemmatimonadaceae bacterium 'strain 138']WKW15390.1 hypothetical protein Strain318_001775 [Gemmatimonadaceae bacterium 'strain 318']